MNISEIAFHYRKLVGLVMIIFVLFGAYSYVTLPSREDPQITIREAVVTTTYPGLNPERVEELITVKLERAIRKIPELKEIRSSSTAGRSTIHVVIEDKYFDLDMIWQDLRDKVAEARAELPTGTGAPHINDTFGDVAVITLALTADGFDMAAMHDMSKHVRDVLYGVEGTKKIEIWGVQDERIFLEVSNARLAQLGFGPEQIAAALERQNIIQPGGFVDTGAARFIIEPTGNFTSLDEIGETLIAHPVTGDLTPVSDLVTISRGYIDPPVRTSYFNGKPAVILAISMLDGGNVLEYAPRMRAAISDVTATMPVGMALDIATYQADQVEATVKGVSSSVVQTLLIVLVVVMLFLGVRTGLIVGAIVPFVMLTTVALMQFTGLELERMSLATLIIALGLLVDNGIVIAEDFKRRLELGNSRDEALRACGKELAVPLFISSLTTILVFLPLMLAQHAAGEYTRSISLVILLSLLTSWVLALCVTPVLCYFFIRVDVHAEGTDAGEGQDVAVPATGILGDLYRRYEAFLHLILRARTVFVAVIIAVFIGSLALMGLVPQQFFPDSDRAQVLVYVELPAGTSTRTTDRRMRDVFAWLNTDAVAAHATSYSGYVGYGGPRFVLSLSPEDPADNTGFLVLNIDDPDNIDDTIDELRIGFRENFPDMFVRVTRMFLGPSDSSKLEVQVKGPDADILFQKAQDLQALLRSVPGTIDIRTNWQNRITKVVVKVDQQRARRAGVTSTDIAQSMDAYFSGTHVTEFRDGDDIIPIIMRADADERFNLDRMRSLNVYSEGRGTNVPLFQIAEFEPRNQYARIEREDMFRTITVEAKSLTLTSEDLQKLIASDIEALGADLPLNHHIEYDGVIAESVEAQKALQANIPIVIGLIILLLVAQFNSYRKPIIIVLTIPLIMTGTAIGLLVTGSAFGFMVTLGIYSLAGIIINNAIVLIDRIDIEKADGKSDYDAVVSACITRLRPIVMTTITTVLGLLPLIVSRDPLFYGMANAMVFGLAVGTILTLGVVPVLYSLLYGVKKDTQ